MVRHRATSATSTASSATDQELGGMYDYLAKIILLGPSGTGKSCLLHRFVKNEWRVLTSQTIGVEFSSKIIRIGTGSRRKRIKLQLWDTAGTERFRSVSRSYYRGAAGALLIYDIASHYSFDTLHTFLSDARALASPNLTLLLVGNKADLSEPDAAEPPPTPQSTYSSNRSYFPAASLSSTPGSSNANTFPVQTPPTAAPDGREVSPDEASRWASGVGIPVSVEVSALNGDGVSEVFAKLARMTLTKIELGEIDPSDPTSGVQYGDSSGGWGDTTKTARSGASGSGPDGDFGMEMRRRGKRSRAGTGSTQDGGYGSWRMGMREWEEVFRVDLRSNRSRGGCC